jgi:hypothetical protein
VLWKLKERLPLRLVLTLALAEAGRIHICRGATEVLDGSKAPKSASRSGRRVRRPRCGKWRS